MARLTPEAKYLKDRFKEAGVPVDVATGGPQFFLELDDIRQKVYVTAPETPTHEIEYLVHPDKSFRQVVFTFVEAAHPLETTVYIPAANMPKSKDPDASFLKSKKRDQLLLKYAKVNLPEGSSVAQVQIGNRDIGYTHNILQFHVTFNVAEQRTCLLIGYDESHLFISQLPSEVKSVTAWVGGDNTCGVGLASNFEQCARVCPVIIESISTETKDAIVGPAVSLGFLEGSHDLL